MMRFFFANPFKQQISRPLLRRYSYLFFLSILGFALPVSLFLISLAMIGLALIWLVEGDFTGKWNRFRSNKALQFFLLIYPVHLLWMINTQDYTYGFHDLRIKLPLLLLPLIAGTTEPLDRKELTLVFYSFILGCFLASVLAIFRFMEVIPVRNLDVRNISGTLSHIRLSLMINLAFFILIWLGRKEQINWKRGLILGFACWFLFFLFFLKSMTGILIFLIIIWSLLFYWSSHVSNRKTKILARCFLLFLPLFCVLYTSWVVHCFLPEHRPDPDTLEKLSPHGNPYTHQLESTAVENGNWVWYYFCESELVNAWNKRSAFPVDGLDKRGQPIRYTLIRYLTSRGLRKDMDGVAALTERDVKLIEEGEANYIFGDRLSLYPYIYRIVWEIYDYRQGGNPSGHSISQRFEYYRTAWHIFKTNPWFGTGTGDVAVSFKQAYEEMNSELRDPWRRRAHNQYLTFLLTFGMVGFSIILMAFILPILKLRKSLDFLDGVFLCIAGLSMINEDTLETHAGVSFVAFFVAILLFARVKVNQTKNETE
jgi:hypothetical protein